MNDDGSGMRLVNQSLDGADRTIIGCGTPEERWQSWSGWADMTEVGLGDLLPERARLVVVAPHPDDEVLGSAGLLCLAAATGHDTLVLAVTDGGGSHPGSRLWPQDVLTPQRALERSRALEVLGVQVNRVISLGIDDGAVTAQRTRLAAALGELLMPGDVVVSPWRLDGHPDHESVAEATMTACRKLGATVLQAPIWGWHWARPEQFPVAAAARLPLDAFTQLRKRRAVSCFLSQLTPDPSTGAEPILPDWAVQRWVRDCEVYLR
ncbi:PIG-L family deacetylase [Jatrophihabitans telluris]|uniref:PIG-L family deacetylase n=1 Tax=Jatrophihabitans telluris TaxID=2038343 RepID=A0ABY4R007_9ACTN|nr:PIG-L family deacetylase [Jatrophihabitans telluris]UQX88832.1 PIG-L family deacetylase [Jatrophihabitans telluris]